MSEQPGVVRLSEVLPWTKVITAERPDDPFTVGEGAICRYCAQLVDRGARQGPRRVAARVLCCACARDLAPLVVVALLDERPSTSEAPAAERAPRQTVAEQGDRASE